MLCEYMFLFSCFYLYFSPKEEEEEEEEEENLLQKE